MVYINKKSIPLMHVGLGESSVSCPTHVTDATDAGKFWSHDTVHTVPTSTTAPSSQSLYAPSAIGGIVHVAVINACIFIKNMQKLCICVLMLNLMQQDAL